jgi:hypothetical protein
MHMLRFVVECNMGRFYEPIAAFNVASAANWYMGECAATNPHMAYRVAILPDVDNERDDVMAQLSLAELEQSRDAR